MPRKHEKHECYDEPLAYQVVEKIPERDISKLLKSMGDGFVIVCWGLAFGSVVFAIYLAYLISNQ
jgi:hypothetical protein